MQRLKEKSRWKLYSRSIWKAGVRARLVAVPVILAWAGISLITSTDSPDSALQTGKRAQYCPTDVESSECMLARNLRTGAQDLQAQAPDTAHEAPGHAEVPNIREAEDALTCLALNVYWEARNQPIAGQLAVAQVTMNRVRDRRYGDNVCDVVYEHKQFSWYWDGKSDTPKETNAWETAYLIASAALNGSGHVELEGVTHYHAVYSQPYWKDHMVQVVMIGDHVFYAD